MDSCATGTLDFSCCGKYHSETKVLDIEYVRVCAWNFETLLRMPMFEQQTWSPKDGSIALEVIVCRQLRAVHLEATGSLDTGDLILAMLRFVARRRCPTTIRTDNGGSFESGRAEVLDPDQKALESRLIGELVFG
jgi:hypothetical protein